MNLCCVPYVAGPLLPDEDSGIVIRVEEESQVFSGIDFHPSDDVRLLPVTWPEGYTGRWAGSAIEVLSALGEFVARTGDWAICYEESSTKGWLCERAEPVAKVPPTPPPFDLAAVRAKFGKHLGVCQVPEGFD